MKQYIKPTIFFEDIENENMLLISTPETHQCDCYTFRVYDGCKGCKGNCGCSHWDPELQEIIPGC